MRDPVIITWNVTNWITIFLMVVLGYALVGLVVGWWKQRNGSSGG